ncbi:MAG: hypothetical protein DLM65_12390 [Candidatus Aeolococcus gillhamiae]|uniref:Uncharacterized protein n=1 Tax=Candidatus Aeolococcus gillhamiae TaxID=3127015 RepID=A0A2W5Z059_9BACT|nr:MAG: hypothetical protein DLM65_12390 [Candidatus Dormibacter sp. RRmetagenome_bin12]
MLVRFLGAGTREWRSPLPHSGRLLVRDHRGGALAVLPAQPAFPPVLNDCLLLSVAVPRGQLGVIHDRRRGTYTAVIRVRDRDDGSSSFGLLDNETKASRMAGWGAALISLAQLGSPVHAVQLLVRTVPADAAGLAHYLSERRVADVRSPILRSYLSLLDDAVQVTQAQQIYIAVQIRAAQARRAIREAGGGDAGAGALLADQVDAFQRQLAAVDIGVDGALPPRLLARVLREAWDPAAAPLFQIAPDGVDPAGAGPLVATRSWRSYSTDSGSQSVSWWVSDWPRSPVGPDYLLPLLLGTEARMSFSLTLQPVDGIRARRDLEAAQTEHLADEQLRVRHGFRTSVDRQRQAAAVERREAELADGHADCRFSGHVTVSAGSDGELQRACDEVTRKATAAGLDLRRMDGEHDLGFSYTLPLARGLW